jgi:prepilin signal peptidase PulO-like enzyme (type II secretory pathway)
MLFFTSGTEHEREGLALSRQSASGALAGEARTARANRDLRLRGRERTRVPIGKLLRIAALVASLGADFVFTLFGPNV